MIRILQISDIHWKHSVPELDNYANFRKHFLRDITDYVEHFNVKFDCILVCGDVSQSGEKRQYEEAADFLKKICQIVGCDSKEVYIVPGNHDKDREKEGRAVRECLYQGLADESQGERLFQGILKEDYNHLKALYLPFTEYNNFVHEFRGIEPLMEKCMSEGKTSGYEETDKLYWKIPLKEENGYEIVLFGINSCLISDRNDFRIKDGKEVGHKLLLSPLGYHVEEPDANQIFMSMMHHPVDCLSKGNEIRTFLDGIFKVQLFGHMHIQKQIHDGCVKVFSGAFQPPVAGDPNTYYPVYNIITLEVVEKEKKDYYLRTKVDTQKWTGTKFETENPDETPHDIKLGISNRFSDIQKLPDRVNGASKHEIYSMVYDLDDPEILMKTLCPDIYDPDETDHTNEVNLLEWAEKENKLTEIWHLMQLSK